MDWSAFYPILHTVDGCAENWTWRVAEPRGLKGRLERGGSWGWEGSE